MSLILCLCITANAKESVYVCDGGIELTGIINSGRSGDVVTVMVFKDSESWQDEDYWKNSDSSNMVYCKETALDKQRSYNFKFYLNSSGIYTALIGSEEFSEIQEETIVYVNKTKNDIALSKISQAANESELAEILADYKSDIGLFGEFYNDINYAEAAKLLFPHVAQNNFGYESVICAIDKACVASQINSDKITEIETVRDYLHMDETEMKFYRKEYSKEICSILKKNKINTIEDFEDSLRESIILCAVNQNDGIGDVKDILNCYADEYGIKKSNLTTDACSALIKKANNTPFNDVSDIVLYVNDYSSPSSQGGGSGSGSGGGYTNKNGNNQLNNVVMPVYKNENNQTDGVYVFDDIGDIEWANEAITELYYKGVINGVSDNEFHPYKNISREEFAKILAKAFKLDLVSEKQCFDDISPQDWCYDYVNSLYISGVVNGISDRVFGKGEDITRQDICVMICRVIDVVKGNINQVNEKAEFADASQIDDYAKESVSKMQAAGIVSGYEDGSFNPTGKATRAEAAKMIYETLLNIKY